MANQNPGLQPGRKLEATNVSFEIESPNADHRTSSQFENVQSKTSADVAENTVANQPEVVEENVQEAPVEQAQAEATEQEQPTEEQSTERADRRIQDIANQRETERQARMQAEARASQYEAMLRNLVNAQAVQPQPSQDELLAKQYKSYDAALGYPSDPKEFADYNRTQARLAAADETKKQAAQEDVNRTVAANPELASDKLLLAQVAVLQQEAQSRGFNLPFSLAVTQAKQHLSERFQAETQTRVVNDDQAKNEAYVETTRGASTNRQSVRTPSEADVNNMSLAEMESALKISGEWYKS